MSEMTKEEKINAVMAGIGLFGLAVYAICRTTIFPYIAIKKASLKKLVLMWLVKKKQNTLMTTS